MTDAFAALRAELPWRAAATFGAAVVLAVSAGDAFVAAALVGVGLGAWPGAAVGLAAAATVARWGTADLGIVAGDQAVLGPAVATGPTLAAVSSGLAGAAVLLACSRRWGIGVLVAGAGGAVLAFGPATTSLADTVTRLGAAAGGLAVALLLTRVSLPAWLGAAAGLAAVATAVAA